MRIHFDTDAVARASAKRLVALVDEGRDEGFIGPLKLGQAQGITAEILGYASWQELRKSLATSHPSTLDENLGMGDLMTRREVQASRLEQVFSMPPEFAGEFIDIWCPSMGPSAYKAMLEEENEDDVFSGPDGFRLAHPVDINFGVELCKGLNWPILSAGDDPELGMGSVFVFGSRQDKPIPIFVSALAYVPGDDSDAQAKLQRQAVSRFMDSFPGAPGCCIVYQWPMLSDGYVFAGSVYRNRRWLDMPWSSSLTSIDVLFEWADRGWDLHARNPQTADKDGKLSALVRLCMQNSDMRKRGML
jgi:hypothetical protein